MSKPDELRKIAEVQQQLGIGRSQFYRLRNAGAFDPLVYVGGSPRIRQSSIDRYLKARERRYAA